MKAKVSKSTPQHAQARLEMFSISDEEVLDMTPAERVRLAELCGIELHALRAHHSELVVLEKKRRELFEGDDYATQELVEVLLWED